ncbi:hypothetical protein C8F01DRAFT_1092176 [Mycena amicta]|nr:hypothetical protein C8F01DRAFT_1092176 [Mycena amicta]
MVAFAPASTLFLVVLSTLVNAQIETCFNCQSVNATQEDEFQGFLDDIVDNCNDRFGSPDSTISISAQKIQPTGAFSSEGPSSTTGTTGTTGNGKKNAAGGAIASVGGLSLIMCMLGIVGTLLVVF